MTCAHNWTVTSECPRCLRQRLDDAESRIEELLGRLHDTEVERNVAQKAFRTLSRQHHKLVDEEAALRHQIDALLPPSWTWQMLQQALDRDPEAVRPHLVLLAARVQGISKANGQFRIGLRRQKARAEEADKRAARYKAMYESLLEKKP